MRSRLAEGVELNFCLRQACGAPSFWSAAIPLRFIYLMVNIQPKNVTNCNLSFELAAASG
jgi:hypothetical protein